MIVFFAVLTVSLTLQVKYDHCIFTFFSPFPKMEVLNLYNGKKKKPSLGWLEVINFQSCDFSVSGACIDSLQGFHRGQGL